VAAGRKFHQKVVEEQKNQKEMVNWQVGETIVTTYSESQAWFAVIVVILKHGTKLI